MPLLNSLSKDEKRIFIHKIKNT
jgi:hypothetical protein